MSRIPCPICESGTIVHGYCKGCQKKVSVGDLAASLALNLSLVDSGETFTAKQVASELGFPERAASNGIKLLVERCKVVKVDEGIYRKRVLHPIHLRRLANPVPAEEAA
jgi:hypothetical protein